MKKQVWKVAGLVVAVSGSMVFAQIGAGTNAVPSKGIGRPSSEEILKRFDTDGDGVLSDAERAALREAMTRRREGPEGKRPDRAEMMTRFDTNGDGVLDDAERAAMREAMPGRRGGPRMSREEMLKRFDADGDGVLSEYERATMRETLRSERPAPPPSEEKPVDEAPAE